MPSLTPFFVRRVGDYLETSQQAFEALFGSLNPDTKIKACYSIALDDPNVAGRSKCRFDACVSVEGGVSPKGEVGRKVLRGGRFAAFTHNGSCRNIEKTFDGIFLSWYPTSKEKLANAPCYCEHVNYRKEMPEAELITKIYIPLEER